jgi:hypothetical protein
MNFVKAIVAAGVATSTSAFAADITGAVRPSRSDLFEVG